MQPIQAQSQSFSPSYKSIKILATSDTHDFHSAFNISSLPAADIFIHAGDFTQYSTPEQHENFINFLKSLPYKHKIIIAGNHDFVLDKQNYQFNQNNFNSLNLKKSKHRNININSQQQIKKLKQHCIYLQHQHIQIQGLKIFGSPYSLEFFQWGFMYKQSQGEILMSIIQQNTDIVVTHGPPYGILDEIYNGTHVGCKQLMKKVNQIKPLVHVFGHIHQAYGKKKVADTVFFNASFVSENYQPMNKPHLIEIRVDKKTGKKEVVMDQDQKYKDLSIFSKITRKIKGFW